MKMIALWAAFLIVMSCSETKSVDFDDFKLQIPKDWKKLKPEGCDSNAGVMVTPNHDSIYYDYGMYSDPLEEKPIILPRKLMKEFLATHPKKDTTGMKLIVVNDDETVNTEDFIKSNVTHTKIDGYRAKILEPKHAGNGITGVYIDRIKNDIKFNLYGENLTKESQTELLKAVRTLQFRK